MNNLEDKKVSIPLAIGIFSIPLIFSWFTLRRGYSTQARVLSFGWLILGFIALALVPTPPDQTDNTQKVEVVENTEAIKKDVQAVKVEANLGMTPEQFRQKFNAKLKDLDIDDIRPLAEFDVKDGSVRDTFQILFTQYVGLTGTVNKDGSLRELIFTVGGTEESEKAMMDLLILSGITTQVISPGTEAGDELVKLITAALKNIGKDENSHKKVIGNVEYYALANEVTGLWVGVSPAGE